MVHGVGPNPRLSSSEPTVPAPILEPPSDARLERATRNELESWIDRLYEVATLEEVFQ